MEKRNLTVVTKFILLGITDHPELQVPLFLLFLIIYLNSLLGKLGMIILNQVDPRLQTPMYFFLRHLALTDLGSSTAMGPKMLVNVVVDQNKISYYGCTTRLAIFLMFIISELFILSAMSYDHYVAICNPLLYSHHVTQAVLGTTFNLISSLLMVLMSYLVILTAILRKKSTESRLKAFSTCGSHLTMVTVFYGTLIFIYVQPGSSHSFDTDKVTSLSYTLVIPMLNPLIYSLRNKDVKYALQRTWKNICKCFPLKTLRM
ncbi:Olfactory receptor 8K5 [Heterocephalus glaber]|uniref:Olfactory receptor 8K5 n=1 Tax=Heterocephalus glaber TaxID=10181 RepID=G5C8N9_HETGA|nr:Olfactory receptor 8K5 [Heterocephalus glaber]